MRVLQLSWEYPPTLVGGLGRHVSQLSRALVADGVSVDVLARGEAARDTARDPPDGVVAHRVAWPPVPRDLDAFMQWVADLNAAMAQRGTAILVDGAVDVVHSHDWLVADAARTIAAHAGVPWVVTVHATEHGRHRGFVNRPPQSTIHAAERAMVADADHVITCSEEMREHVATVLDVGRARITTLPNGLAAQAAPAADLAELRTRLAPAGERLVLLAGRLVYEKGFDVALEALAPLARARGDLRILVAGTGPTEDDLRRQSRRLGLTRSTRFLGWVGDDALHALYRVADVCVVPSRYEPFGLVALEAMAAGCPCVVADTGGLREIVPGDGTVGLRVAGEDAPALGAAVQRLLDDAALRARIADAARVHVRHYDWSRVARATRGIYERLAATAPAPG